MGKSKHVWGRRYGSSCEGRGFLPQETPLYYSINNHKNYSTRAHNAARRLPRHGQPWVGAISLPRLRGLISFQSNTFISSGSMAVKRHLQNTYRAEVAENQNAETQQWFQNFDTTPARAWYLAVYISARLPCRFRLFVKL